MPGGGALESVTFDAAEPFKPVDFDAAGTGALVEVGAASGILGNEATEAERARLRDA